MTKEELLQLSKEDLVGRILELKSRQDSQKESSDHWYREHKALDEKFNRYRDAVKSVVLFID